MFMPSVLKSLPAVNLQQGDKWDLRNRYLHIHATDEWKVQQNLAGGTSNQQEEYKYGTSTGQVQDKLQLAVHL